jgi:hypothetical protein
MSRNEKQTIQDFIEVGHTHLDADGRMRSSIFALVAFGLLALPVELMFVLRGHRVPVMLLLLPVSGALLTGYGYYLKFRFDRNAAVNHMDRFFNLKEGLVTAHETLSERRGGEIHDLQCRHTRNHIKKLDAAALRSPLPRRLLTAGAVLLLLSGGLLFVDDSFAVKEAKAEEEAALQLSEDVVEELEEAFEKMLKEMDRDAAKLLEDPALKEMMSSLDAGKDRMSVMRKLSEIDRQMAKMQSQFDTRADESYLQELGQQLEQAAETADLGKALSSGNYKQAAQKLQNMQMGSRSNAQQQKSLEKLGARIGEVEKSMSSSKSAMRRNAQELRSEISKMMQEQKKNGSCSQGCKDCLNQSLCKNGNGMKMLACRKQARSSLEQMRQKLQSCQSCMKNGNKPGGGAGSGVDRSMRPPQPQLLSGGRMEQLSGQLGQGESRKEVLAADSGHGAATGGDTEQTMIEYAQKAEAFVRREDIPEEMKHGVKTYFKQIHALEQQLGEGVK